MSLRRRLVELSLLRLDVDRWAVIYLAVTVIYAALNPSVFPAPWKLAAVHAGIGLAVWFVPPLLRGRRHWAPRLLGEIYLPLIFPLFYAELEHLGLIFFAFEESLDPSLIALEESIFGFQPSLEWSRVWPWPWFHELMEFAYFSYYFLAAIFVALVFRGREVPHEERWEVVRNFVRDLAAVMLLCYTLYTVFPAWGPKYFRAGYIEVDGWIFTRIMLHIHENGALLGAAFPSSHVAASLIPWWHTWRRFPRHRWWMSAIFVLLCMSTVYCRYHYVVDVGAGLVLAALVLVVGHGLGTSARDRLVRPFRRARGFLREKAPRSRDRGAS